MSHRNWILIVLGFISVPVVSADWKSETLMDIENHRYVRAWNILAQVESEDPIREAILMRLLTNAEQQGAQEPSLSGSAYFHGFEAWSRGDKRGAENQWNKYLAYCRYLPESCLPTQRKEIEDVRNEYSSRKKENIPSDLPKSVPVVVPVLSPPRNKKQAKVPPPPSYRSIPSSPETSRELAREAIRAKENGQLEYALRLYKLAENADPATLSYESEIEELNRIVK